MAVLHKFYCTTFFDIITCDFSIYTMDHSDLNSCSIMENSSGLKKVNSIPVVVLVIPTCSQIPVGISMYGPNYTNMLRR